MVAYKVMTKKEVASVVADFSAAMPGWQILDKSALYRDCGPVRQMIWFQALRTGAYRPMNGVSALSQPLARMLAQMLDVRHRETKLSQHAERLPETLSAMKQQFQPAILEALDVAEVTRLCDAAARETTNDFTMLAILHAWLGHKTEALDYCERLQRCPMPTLGPVPEWEERMRSFGRSLARAVGAGTERAFLERSAEEAQPGGGGDLAG